MGLRFSTPLAALVLAGGAPAQTLVESSPVKGVLETYFYSTRLDRGASHRLTWGEFYYRARPDLKLTYSFGLFPGGHVTDEAVAAYDRDGLLVRAGRMRTTFGFNDWSDLFYNGFNSIPLVRAAPLSDGLVLTRQDSGVEATVSIGDAQLEVAAVDASLRRDQIAPDNVDAGIVRLQMPAGALIVGLDALRRLRHDGGIYGVDVRYTLPRLVGRLEYFVGDGAGSGQGGYADVQARLPGLPRTQLVARADYLKPAGGAASIIKYTVGLRQIFWNYLQVNVNYAWGHNLLFAPSAPAAGTDNFSARAMFQVRF